MTDVALATMSTALWLIATVSLFILLAGWSTGTSWGLSASIVRGIRGWADRDGRAVTVSSPVSTLRPILDPYAFVRRGTPQGASPNVASTAAQWGPDVFGAEIIELGERPLPG